MKLFLSKKWVTTNDLTVNGVLAYVALRKIMDNNILLKTKEDMTMCITVNNLAFSLIGNEEYEKQFIDALRNGLEELATLGAIKVVRDLSIKQHYEAIIDLENLYLDTSKEEFIVVFDDELKKILLLDEAVKRKVSMVRYFIVLVGTMDWSMHVPKECRGKVNHMPQSYLIELSNISEKTCQRYNDILSDNHIIYMYKTNDKIKYTSNNSLKQINNCYSRYSDRKLCLKYASNFEEEQGYAHKLIKTQKEKEQADNNRRLAQIYNQIASGNADKYDMDTIRDVYRYVSNKNKFLQKEITEIQKREHLSINQEYYLEQLQKQVRDLSVFPAHCIKELGKDKDIWGETNSMEIPVVA